MADIDSIFLYVICCILIPKGPPENKLALIQVGPK